MNYDDRPLYAVICSRRAKTDMLHYRRHCNQPMLRKRSWVDEPMPNAQGPSHWIQFGELHILRMHTKLDLEAYPAWAPALPSCTSASMQHAYVFLRKHQQLVGEPALSGQASRCYSDAFDRRKDAQNYALHRPLW